MRRPVSLALRPIGDRAFGRAGLRVRLLRVLYWRRGGLLMAEELERKYEKTRAAQELCRMRALGLVVSEPVDRRRVEHLAEKGLRVGNGAKVWRLSDEGRRAVLLVGCR